jgi:hypothetical protein
MRAHMTVWSLRMFSRPELAFIGRDVSLQLLGWIDGAVAAQDAVDRARKAVQARAQSAASRFAGRALNAAGRVVPLGNARQLMDQAARPDAQHPLADLASPPTGTSRPDDALDQPGGGAIRTRVGRWLLGRGHQSN